MKRLLLFTAVTIFLTGNYAYAQKLSAQQVRAQKEFSAQIDDYAAQVMKTWELPGFALAVSVDNRVIYSKGFGVKELRPADGVGFKGVRYDDRSITSGGVPGVVNEPGSPIGEKTIFQIGSVSKSFTATVLAQLVDEGKLKWTDTIKNILPDFKMFRNAPYVTENMLVRDAMLHSTGLVNEAGTYFGNLGYDREDNYRMLGRLDPGFSFRGGYDYNNTTFQISAKIIELLTGKSWEENVQERVFKPLGMKASALNADGFALREDVATPHDWRYKGARHAEVLPLYANEQALYWLTVIGPAGGVSSNIEDMIKYAQFHCNNGYLVNRDADGNVRDTSFIMSNRAMKGLHRGYTVTSQDSTKTNLYALCWFVEQNNNYRLYFHTGTTWGMTALCFYVPEYKLCGVMLVNSECNANPRYAMMRRIIDLVRSNPEFVPEPVKIKNLRDYNAEYYESYTASRDKAIAEAAEKPKKEIVAEVADKSVFAGVYEKDELFGDAYITYEGGELYFELAKKHGVPGFKNILRHVSGTRYEYRCDGYGFGVTFNQDDSGKVTGFLMEFGEGEEETLGGWTKSDKK